jgi:hypothetical protein
MAFQNFKFGVEIEFNNHSQNVRHDIARAMTDMGLRTMVTSYGQRNIPRGVWQVSSDGSCGSEIITPILSGEGDLAMVGRVATMLKDMGMSVDTSCGLHVHVSGFAETEQKTLRNVVRRFVNFEDTFDLLQPSHRRGDRNTYCLSNARRHGSNPVEQTAALWGACYDTPRETLVSKISPTRYYKLNLTSLDKHGTIEFRHHAGTLDAVTIEAWVKFLCAFIDVATAQERLWKRPVGKVEAPTVRLAKMLRGVPAPVATVIKRRFNAMATS